MRKYVLSVDSRGITGLEIEKMLKNLDVYVVNVPNALRAEAAIKNRVRHYSLVIWTVNTGEEHSYDVIKELVDKGVFSDIPVVVVSDCTQKREVVKAIECGAFYYITRPYEESALEKISDFLGVSLEKPFKAIRDSVVYFTFDDILEKEVKSASRGGYPVSFMVLLIKKEGSQQELDFEKTEVLAAVLKRRLRNSDIVMQTDMGTIFLLLPFANAEGVETVKNRITELMGQHSAIKKTIEGCYTRMSSVTYPDDGKTREELLAKLKKRLDKAATTMN